MLDTIVLILTQDTFKIVDPEAFTPSAAWALSHKSQRGMCSKQNPTKKALLKGIYKPRLTLSHRINTKGIRDIALKIELSLPKLLFGNNFAELRFKDFAAVVDQLVVKLATMGIVTTSEFIAQAPVSAIHYSKNICLTDGSTPNYYINKIKEANITLSLDTNQTDYRNEGHSYKWHANSYEVVFYDKIRDLEKAQTSNKRAIESDNELQLSLFKQLQKRSTKFEVLRMEVRLNRRTKIKQLFAKLDIPTDLTFKKLFKPAISKKVLLYYFDEAINKRPKLLDYKAASDKALLVDLIINNTDLGPKKILQLYGLKKALDVANPRELRVMFARYATRSWYRLIADANNIKLSSTYDQFRVIKEQLVKFEPIKLKLT